MARCASHAVTAPTQVEGVVLGYCAYGPPNYGEDPVTDSKEAFDVVVLDAPLPALQLDSPFGATCISNIRMLQVATEDAKLRNIRVIGKHVKFTVKEWMVAETGHHHSRVLLWYAQAQVGANVSASLGKLWPQVEADFLGTSCAGYPH